MKYFIFLGIILTGSCDTNSENSWKVLFDGTSSEGWRAFNKMEFPDSWKVENGELKCVNNTHVTVDNLVYERIFEDFILVFDWKISEKGNSGVMYHVQEGDRYKEPYETGPEYQLLDDFAYDGRVNSQMTASDYDMTAADTKGLVKNAGEWNTSKILFSKDIVEHWLNGKKVMTFKPWSEDWKALKGTTKWQHFPDYGKFKKGIIVLQDHGQPISFKNIKIKEIK